MKFSVVGIQHPHIYGMTSELVAHGAELVSAYDSDKTALDAFVKKYRGVKAARCEEEILEQLLTASSEKQLADIISRG